MCLRQELVCLHQCWFEEVRLGAGSAATGLLLSDSTADIILFPFGSLHAHFQTPPMHMCPLAVRVHGHAAALSLCQACVGAGNPIWLNVWIAYGLVKVFPAAWVAGTVD